MLLRNTQMVFEHKSLSVGFQEVTHALLPYLKSTAAFIAGCCADDGGHSSKDWNRPIPLAPTQHRLLPIIGQHRVGCAADKVLEPCLSLHTRVDAGSLLLDAKLAREADGPVNWVTLLVN